MKTTHYVLTTFVILTLALSACTSQGTPVTDTAVPTDIATEAPTATEAATATEAPTATEAATAEVPVTGGGVLNVMQDSSGTSFLVDGSGMTVYINTDDTPDTSTCYDDCAAEWPAVISTGDTTSVGDGVDSAKLGTLTRTDGTTQLTYNGWPLYTFADDTQSGDMLGQGDEDMWFIVSPEGEAIQDIPSPEASPSPTP